MTFLEDEIDLRPYIHTLLVHWKQIILLAAITALSGLAFSLLQPRTYKASATAIVTRSQLRLSLAEQFTTIKEAQDINSRMDAFLAIANSDGITQKVTQALIDRLPSADEEQLQKELVEITNNGDAILISATYDDPELAADLANTWAREATLAINLAYNGEQPLTEIQGQLAATKSAYEIAQTALETFIAENQIDVLKSQITSAETLLFALADDQATSYAFYDNRRQAMDAILVQAEALKIQLQEGSVSTAGRLGDSLAVLFARAKSMGILDQNILASNPSGNSNSSPAFSLDIQLPNLETITPIDDEYTADLQSLINLAKDEKTKAELQLNMLGQEVAQGEQPELQEALALQLRSLETQLEREAARELILSSDRNLAWEIYQALLKKEKEILTAAPASSEVVLVSLALPPQEPVSRQTILKTAIAGLLGLMLGVLWTFVKVWWRSEDLDTDGHTTSETSEQM